jgi:energy-coupling factor transport system ATP-binding protein
VDGPAVALREVGFRYRGTDESALAGVNLEIRPGEFIVLLGPSGAGKSTLCLTLNGLIPHFVRGRLEGEVEVGGTPVRDARVPELARKVGLVFQDFEAQLFATNVELEVAFGLENFGVPVEVMRGRVAETLALVGLTGLEGREPATLSGGQKQRLAIAAVLALEPDLVVMDEPTTDLDPEGTEEVFQVARQLREQGRTVILAEHETEEAIRADRVVVLDRGEVVASGTPDEVLTRSGWLRDLGIQPPGGAELLDALGEAVVLDPDRATALLRERGWHVPGARWNALLARDREPAPGRPLIQVESLEHRYGGGVLALQGVDLTLGEGEFLGIVGANGSGKTTLAKHLNGLLHPTAGRVLVEGRPTTKWSMRELGLRVGYVFQNPDHQIFAETVREEVAFAPRNHGVPDPEVERRVAESIEAVDLTGREEEDPFTMSKGERQRVAVASVLATRPKVIILDEPTTGLDHGEQRAMMKLVRELNAAGHTIVCVTHAMWVVAEFCRRTVVMAEGRVLADGPTRQVFSSDETLRAAGLRAPHLVRITSALGRTLLSAEEARAFLTREP